MRRRHTRKGYTGKKGIVNDRMLICYLTLFLIINFLLVFCAINAAISKNKLNKNTKVINTKNVERKDNKIAASKLNDKNTNNIIDSKNGKDKKIKENDKKQVYNKNSNNKNSSNKNGDIINKNYKINEKNSEADNNKNEINNKKRNRINDKEYFKDSVFMGDSVTEGLSFYEFIDESRVIAYKGFTLVKAKKEINRLCSMKPKKVYLFFGLNDVEYGISNQEFISNYQNLVLDIKRRLPNTKIYIQSITPIQNKAENKKTNFTNEAINGFNKSALNMAKNNNFGYLNIASILQNHNDKLYEDDGIHFKYNFYRLWLDYVKDCE